MRKFVCMLLVSASVLSSKAQVLQLPEKFSSEGTVWIVRAGVSLSGVSGKGADAVKDGWSKNKWSGDFKRSLGGNVSIGFNKAFGKGPLYWGMELGVAMRGYKTEANWSRTASSKVSGGYDSHTKSEELTLNTFNAQLSPINIGYKYIINNKMAVDVHVGGFASYDFAGNLKSETYDHVYVTGNYGTNDKTTEGSTSTSLGDLNGYRRYDFGVIVGIGFWYGCFNIDLDYQRGFVSLFEGDNKLMCNKLQVRLGYAF